MFKILRVSVPIPILSPTIIFDGIWDKNISVVNPADGDPVIVETETDVSISFTLILTTPFKDDKSVVNPVILTISLFFKLWISDVDAVILLSDHVSVTSCIICTFVFKFDIDSPFIFDIDADRLLPPVPVSSNLNNSPTL